MQSEISGSSLYALALEKFTTPSTVTCAEVLGPEFVREQAVRYLQSYCGVTLLGDPSLVAWAIDRAAADYSEFLNRSAEKPVAVPRRGRPSNHHFHNLILTAAVHECFQRGLGKTAARREAARRLGKPITADRVEKAAITFYRIASRFNAGKEGRLKLAASLILFAQDTLDKIEQEMRQQASASSSNRRARRYYSSTAPFSAPPTSGNVDGPPS